MDVNHNQAEAPPRKLPSSGSSLLDLLFRFSQRFSFDFIATLALAVFLIFSSAGFVTPLIHAISSQKESEQCVHALASLYFYLSEENRHLKHPSDLWQIAFTPSDVDQLWRKVKNAISQSKVKHQISLYQKAAAAFDRFRLNREREKSAEEAKRSLLSSMNQIKSLWQKELNREIRPLQRKKRQSHEEIENNPFISKEAQEQMAPYLIDNRHPMKRILHALFSLERITLNKHSFTQAGFEIIAKGPRSRIVVGRHPALPGYLVKAHFDSQLENKQRKASWKWLVLRCQGAEKIRIIIKKLKISLFTVAKKWIYCLPPDPSPPEDSLYQRHLAILLVTDMHLAQSKENFDAWKNRISRKHLDDLFRIISRARGSSYRPDNIAYTQEGTFAFIDTEYPDHGPDFKSIRRYLNPHMRSYWDALIRQGGP